MRTGENSGEDRRLGGQRLVILSIGEASLQTRIVRVEFRNAVLSRTSRFYAVPYLVLVREADAGGEGATNDDFRKRFRGITWLMVRRRSNGNRGRYLITADFS